MVQGSELQFPCEAGGLYARCKESVEKKVERKQCGQGMKTVDLVTQPDLGTDPLGV